MFDHDTTSAQWAQQELDQRHYFEHHQKVNTDYRNWLIQEGYMKVSQMIESKFLKKEDFEQDQVCTIRGLKQENVGRDDSPEMRWTLYFNEHQKAMVLNVTTIRVLEAAFGDESDEWKGKKVMVYVDPNVSFQGRVVGGLRLRPPKKQPVAAAAKVADPDFDDAEIPF